ncbi:ROK family transcriptional regulator [Cellulomonas fimi]|uniref:ROK family protein n=1 Tax=Cellulomonas fimi (strain ATCC 484 / DSM 20113 / JCM 1341 / CCUG 24087 / LMG 16345 / NBRC 15513 / NCIMB 8980 / NCTC 7547 / NRS-133) TaxID=590998 RepID=F4H6T2_CELFA|nr:ROK family transcriptional regulator [Cellulomonas fimi]AEE46843.1 ROK family protein [Cellulomonas fimi ATCC 484]NNH06386.1 ROK family transcriptional regulator [Cellulomonas fimi]VEH34340.1 Making large colonies protein [Cellulomonas fimi]
MVAEAPEWAEGGSELQVALEVLLRGPLSRAELARRLDLSQPTLTRLTKDLVRRGLLVESDARPGPAVGRPSQPLDVDATSHHFVGVNLAVGTAHAVLVDLRGTVVATSSADLPQDAPEAVVAVVGDLADAVVAAAPAGTVLAGVPTGLGVSLGGHSPDGTTVHLAPFLGWHDVPLGALVRERTGLPTVVENDVAALASAEHWFGAGRDARTFAVVTVGAGVGYGLVVHDRLVRHADMGLGLVGHFPLDPNGPLCPEGHRGCAGAMLTTEALEAEAAVALRRPVTSTELLDLARDGDPAARRIVDDAGRALGRLVAAVANLTMPDLVVLTGEGVDLAVVADGALRAALAADRNPKATPVDLVVEPGDFSQWARGAAVVAIQDYVLRSR